MPHDRKALGLALTLRALAALALAQAAAPLAGCQDFGDVTGSIGGSTAMPTDEAKLRAYVETCGKRYERDPGEKTVSIEYARALRALTRYSEAVAVIQTAAIKAPKDLDVLGEYGKALADAGELAQAKDVLSRAYTPDAPRWDVMSVQGAVADRLGDHAGAMQFYRDALKIAPGEPSVLTNMGLSLALAKQLPAAEQALRQAVASPKADARMRGDLALVLALEGKFSEAETVGRTDLTPEAAHANVEAIRQMIAENDSWRELRKPAKAAEPKAPAPPPAPAESAS
jgi:Flp pilus assembly protein TadD